MTTFEEAITDASNFSAPYYYDYLVIINSYLFVCMMKRLTENHLGTNSVLSSIEEEETFLQQEKVDLIYSIKCGTTALVREKKEESDLDEEPSNAGIFVDGDVFFDCNTGDDPSFDKQQGGGCSVVISSDNLKLIDSSFDIAPSKGVDDLVSYGTSSSSNFSSPKASCFDELINSHTNTKNDINDLISKALKLCDIEKIKQYRCSFVDNEASSSSIAATSTNIATHGGLNDNPIIENYFICDPSAAAVALNISHSSGQSFSAPANSDDLLTAVNIINVAEDKANFTSMTCATIGEAASGGSISDRSTTAYDNLIDAMEDQNYFSGISSLSFCSNNSTNFDDLPVGGHLLSSTNSEAKADLIDLSTGENMTGGLAFGSGVSYEFELVHKFKDEDDNDVVVPDSHIPIIDDLLPTPGDFPYTSGNYNFSIYQGKEINLIEIDEDGASNDNQGPGDDPVAKLLQICFDDDYIKLSESFLEQNKTKTKESEMSKPAVGTDCAGIGYHPTAIIDYGSSSPDTISRLRNDPNVVELPFASKKNRFIRIKQGGNTAQADFQSNNYTEDEALDIFFSGGEGEN